MWLAGQRLENRGSHRLCENADVCRCGGEPDRGCAADDVLDGKRPNADASVKRTGKFVRDQRDDRWQTIEGE